MLNDKKKTSSIPPVIYENKYITDFRKKAFIAF